LFLFFVLISNASCQVETTIYVETILLITLLVENNLMLLPNLVHQEASSVRPLMSFIE